MEEKEIKKLLDKFNAGECSADELQLLQTLMHDLDTEVTNLQEPAVHLKQIAWQKIEKRIQPTGKIRHINASWLKIAAVALIALFASIFISRIYQSSTKVTAVAYQLITAPKGQMKQISLPDSSIVYLNAASTIKVPVEFTGKNVKYIY